MDFEYQAPVDPEHNILCPKLHGWDKCECGLEGPPIEKAKRPATPGDSDVPF